MAFVTVSPAVILGFVRGTEPLRQREPVILILAIFLFVHRLAGSTAFHCRSLPTTLGTFRLVFSGPFGCQKSITASGRGSTRAIEARALIACIERETIWEAAHQMWRAAACRGAPLHAAR